MRALLSLLVVSAVGTFASGALADQTEPGKFVMPDTVIYGRVQKPSAVIEIQRVQPWIAVKDLAKPAESGVEAATRRGPF